MASVIEMRKESLGRALENRSEANYETIFEGFAELGIEEEDIEPRVNVFTFNAWRALGRHVKKGQHGVKITTWIPVRGKEGEKEAAGGAPPAPGDKSKGGKLRPKTCTVFHVSQTEKD
jgi:hypothetical protein